MTEPSQVSVDRDQPNNRMREREKETERGLEKLRNVGCLRSNAFLERSVSRKGEGTKKDIRNVQLDIMAP